VSDGNNAWLPEAIYLTEIDWEDPDFPLVWASISEDSGGDQYIRAATLAAENEALEARVRKLEAALARTEANRGAAMQDAQEEYQRAEAAEARVRELERAGDRLSVAAQTTGGTAGRDEGLVEAITGWQAARALASQGGQHDRAE
jgi:hypothetical protein